jgi:hypothetical protein
MDAVIAQSRPNHKISTRVRLKEYRAGKASERFTPDVGGHRHQYQIDRPYWTDISADSVTTEIIGDAMMVKVLTEASR